MPRFAIIYIKRTDNTPGTTVITYIFPDGQKVEYESDNVIVEAFTKEEIIEQEQAVAQGRNELETDR